MGAIGKYFKDIAYTIPDVDRHQVDRLARLFDNMEGMAIQGAAGSTGPIYVPGSPTGNPRYFKLAGETNDANSWGGAGYFQYSDNGSTLITQIDDAGYIFNEQGSDIDFRIEGDTDTNLFVLDAGSDVIGIGGAVDASYKLKVHGATAIDGDLTFIGAQQIATSDSGLLTLYPGNRQVTLKATGGAATLAIYGDEKTQFSSTSLLQFWGHNDADQAVLYGTIYTTIDDDTDGTEDGKLVFKVMVDGSSTEALNITAAGLDIAVGLDLSDGNITNVGEIDLDLIRADAANGSITIELDDAAGADLLVGNNNALVVEGDNDRIGMGTNVPLYPFHLTSVAGPLTLAYYYMDISATSGFYDVFAMKPRLDIASGTASTKVSSIVAQPDTAVGGTDDLTNAGVRGFLAQPLHKGGGRLGQLYAMLAYPDNNNVGTVTNQRGIDIQAAVTNVSGTTDDNRGIMINTPVATGTLTANYAIYIANQNNAGTDYGIYTNAGKTSFGDDLEFRQATAITTTSGDFTVTPAGGDTKFIGNVHINPDAAWSANDESYLYLGDAGQYISGRFSARSVIHFYQGCQIESNAGTVAFFGAAANINVGIGGVSPTNATLLSIEDGITFKESSVPTADATYGKIWTTSVNELFFQSGDGTNHLLHGDAFSNIWFHSTSTVEVTISTQNAMTKIDSFTVVGHEDDLANVVGSSANNNLTLSAIGGGEYEISFHASVTATGGADKEMIVALGITLATAKDITDVTDDTVTPIVITSNAHGLENGDMVEIAGVLGNTAANGSFVVAGKTTNTFVIVKLDGSATTGNGDFDEGSPTGDVTIEYPGNMVIHRTVRGADPGAISATGIHILANSDVLALYVANLDGTTNLTVAAVSFDAFRLGD